MRRLPAIFILLGSLLHGADARAQADASQRSAAPAASLPAEAAAADGDWSWRNGVNRQPASLLTTGPVAWSLYVDLDEDYDTWRPADHTIFPGTVAARSDELALNLAMLGVDVTGIPHLIGSLRLQYGTYPAAAAAPDPTLRRGQYLGAELPYVQRAIVGWHFDALQGVNVIGGIVPGYIGGESYLPEENWNYTHTLLLENVPYYWPGVGVQVQATSALDVELWLVNGWQTYGELHDTPDVGYFVNWRPSERLSLVQDGYFGRDTPGDRDRVRLFSDNSAQWELYKGDPTSPVDDVALEASVDLMHENATALDPRVGFYDGDSLYGHVVFRNGFAAGVRAGFTYDPEQTLEMALPTGGPLPRGRMWAYDLTATIDYRPSPWLLLRLEGVHRAASVPYFAGPGGITPPAGSTGGFTPDLRQRDDRVILDVTLRM